MRGLDRIFLAGAPGRRWMHGAAALLTALLIASPAVAADAVQAPPRDPTADPDMVAAGFLTSHPDLRYRLAGVEALRNHAYEDAFRNFLRAARYADKPSQGVIAELYWEGNGVPADRALGYVWMDLAAERGYRPFIIRRERYWEAMDEAERARALEVGAGVYAEYGDPVSKPRIAAVLRRARREVTGSRTGMAGNLRIIVPGLGGQQIDGSKFYDPVYWDPEKYQAWHDATWQDPPVGAVNVGDVENVGTAEPVD